MGRTFCRLIGIGLAMVPAAASAQTTDDDKMTGIYAVARVGGVVNAEQKLDRDSIASSTFQNKTKFEMGLNGEIGGGYDFGLFRLEQTIGYSNLKLDRKKAEEGGFLAGGRNNVFTMNLSGFVDIPLRSRIQPFVGGGIGVVRVDGRLSRVDAVTGAESRYGGKDWGLAWHGDAGVGIRVAPGTIVEVAGRYTRIAGVKLAGQTLGADASFKPKLSTATGTVGLRYMF